MINTTVSIVINKSSDAIFAYLANPANTAAWVDVCVSLAQVSPGPMAVGAKLLYTHKRGPKPASMDGVITGFEPGRRLAFHYDDPMFGVDIEFALEAREGGTLVTQKSGIQTKTFVAKLFTPLIMIFTAREQKKDLGKLKGILEKI